MFLNSRGVVSIYCLTSLKDESLDKILETYKNLYAEEENISSRRQLHDFNDIQILRITFHKSTSNPDFVALQGLLTKYNVKQF